MDLPLIDTHAHFLPPFYRQALAEAGHLPGPDGYHKIPEWSLEDHITFMETVGLQKSYLSISSPGVYLKPPVYGDESTAIEAAALARRINEYGANIKAQDPTRFGYFASLPLPDVTRSLEEIDYCIKELAVDGFVLMSNAFGMYLGDDRMSPIYEKLSAAHTVIFVHPTVPCATQNAFPSSAASAAQADGKPLKPPSYLAANTPLIDCYGGPMLEFLFDSTRTFSDVFLTGTASRFPGIRWIIPHCGATLPSVLDRVIRFSQLLPAKAGSMRTVAPLSEASIKELLASRFYFDLAGIPMHSQIHHILRWVDYTRLLYGSDVPFSPWPVGKMLADEVRGELIKIFGVEDELRELKRICHGNAEKLFSKP